MISFINRNGLRDADSETARQKTKTAKQASPPLHLKQRERERDLVHHIEHSERIEHMVGLL
jgi:hypothetical protein